MSTTFPSDHPFFGFPIQIQEISKDFFQATQLGYFSFVRAYKSGSFTALASQSDFMVDWFESYPLVTVLPESYDHLQSFSFLWDDSLDESVIAMAQQKYGMFHGIATVHRYKDFYDLVCFTFPEEKWGSASFYLTHHKMLNDFYQRFTKVGRFFIDSAEKKKILLPVEKQDKNISSLIIPGKSKRFPFKGTYGPTYITTHELICLDLLEKGRSYKEIGEIMSISWRTVDTYMDRVKKRSGYTQWQEILLAFLMGGHQKLS